MTSMVQRSSIIALIVAGSQFMQNLDSAIINTSLPQMAGSFSVTPVDLSIGVTAYILATAAFVPLGGWFVGRLGGRSVFALAILIFTAASVACAAAETLPQFVAARAAQGLGGALMAPVGQAIVLRNTDKAGLMKAMALITWPSLLAPVIGPALGGFITTYSSWRWNFLLNIPFGGVAIALALIFVPPDRAQARVKLDIRGFVLCSTGLVCLLEGFELMASAASVWTPIILICVGLSCGFLAVRHLRGHHAPLLNLSPLRQHTYRIAVADAGMAFRAIATATPFLLPLMFQTQFGLNAAMSGLLLLVYFLGNIGMKPATTPLLRRFGFRSILFANGSLVGVGVLACVLLSPTLPIAIVVALLFFVGATRSMQFTALNTISFSDIKSEDKVSASTLASMMQQVSMAMGVATAALLLHASTDYRGVAAPGLFDFRVAFVAFGLLGLLAAHRFRSLPLDAASEVSGHKPKSMIAAAAPEPSGNART